MMQFELPKKNEESSIIKVIGVGGGGSNAVNYMYQQGIKGVDFIVCNTDKQSLDISPVPTKIVLGASLTEGRGAGSIPEVGRNAAVENIEEIKQILSDGTKMVFITAGMGGGTGTGAAPVIAKAAKELGILTVGIVTIPFVFEGKKRKSQAEQGLEELRQNVDTLLIICNDKLREMYGNLKLTEAFSQADSVLTTAAKGIADIITTTMHINTDFADITTVMKNSGVAIMGSASASGENRSIKAVEEALMSPLLNDNDIRGARFVLLNITCGNDEITMDELGEITDYIQEAAGQSAELIKGYGIDPTLEDKVNVTIIATGFNKKQEIDFDFTKKEPEKIVYSLDSNTGKSETDNVSEIKSEVAKSEVSNNVSEEKVSFPQNETSKENEVSETEPYIIEKSTEEKQVIIEFEVKKAKEELKSNPSISISSSDNFQKSSTVQASFEPKITNTDREFNINTNAQSEDQYRKAQERIMKLKELSLKLKTSQGLSELENEPAYKRRNIQLDSVLHSSESQVSRFTLSEGEDKKAEIKPNNSFLHDNVD